MRNERAMVGICTDIDKLIDPRQTRLILYPDDLSVETDVNTWWLSVYPQDAREDLDKIEAKLQELAHAWTTRFVDSKCRANRALFYCWYDELAGQLRVSLGSVIEPQRYFGAMVACVDSPRPIIQQMLNAGVFSIDALVPVTEGDNKEDELPSIQLIWAVSHTW